MSDVSPGFYMTNDTLLSIETLCLGPNGQPVTLTNHCVRTMVEEIIALRGLLMTFMKITEPAA